MATEKKNANQQDKVKALREEVKHLHLALDVARRRLAEHVQAEALAVDRALRADAGKWKRVREAWAVLAPKVMAVEEGRAVDAAIKSHRCRTSTVQ